MIISPNNFFENELISEFCECDFIKPQTLVYLAGTLEKNIKIENSFIQDKKPSYMGDLIKSINEEPNFIKVTSLTKQLAETSLFISSFFPDLISKRNNSIDFYSSVGSLAYYSLESYNTNKDLKIAYKNMSQNFSLISEKIRNIDKGFSKNNLKSEPLIDLGDKNLYLDFLKKTGLK